MAKIDVEFRVKTNELIPKNERLFVCGSAPDLGNWYPKEAKAMVLQESSKVNNFQIWSIYVMMTVADVQYRYFIGQTDDNHEFSDERSIRITSWESNIRPRTKSIYAELMNSTMQLEPSLDQYGYIDDHLRVLHGWLLDQTLVQIRIQGTDSVRLYKSRHKLKRMFLKCKHFEIRKEGGSDSESEDSPVLDFPKIDYKSAKVSKLCENWYEYQEIPDRGVEFCGGYLIFQFETMDLEATGFELEIFQMSSDRSRPVSPSPSNQNLNGYGNNDTKIDGVSNKSPSSCHHRLHTNEDGYPILIGVARLAMIPNDRVEKAVPIYDNTNRPIGEIKLDYMAVFPLMGYRFSMQNTYQKYWKFRKTLNVGHKGSGTSYGVPNTTMSAVRENTLLSLRNAFEHGADFVEFDVQLTKDQIPVLYHDFKVATILRRKKKNDMQYMEIPVKDLDLKDLQALKVDHTSVLNHAVSTEHIVETEDIDPEDLHPFPTLERCLQVIDPHLGFNIELKYPQYMHDGLNEQNNYFNRNNFLDRILHVVVNNAQKRRIIFSSFDPDICLMLSVKQNKYPIMFLCQGETESKDRYKDLRTQTMEKSMYFALNTNLLGLCALSTALKNDLEMTQKIIDHKLILFLWGEDNNDIHAQQTWRKLGVHGLIFDRIHEFQEHGSKNIFTLDCDFSCVSTTEVKQC